MFTRIRVLLIVSFACLLAACALPDDSEEPAVDLELRAQALGSSRALSGIYHWDAPNGPVLADEASRWLGREQQLALAYTENQKWSDLTGPSWQLPAWSTWVRARAGRRLVYAVALLPGPSNGAGPDGTLGTSDDVSLQKCSDGAYDATWRTLANNLTAYGLGNTILRLGWEFNGDWYAWRAGGREAAFAGCFRRVVTSMRAAQPSASFQFDWNPTEDISGWSAAQINAAWPGDAYVDYIGVDAYDASWAPNSYPYPANCDRACRLTRQTNAWNDLSRGLYAMRDMAVAHNKRLSIPEWGVWRREDGHGGGDNPFYIGKIYDFVSAPENQVAYQIYFDVNWQDGDHQLSNVNGTGLDSSASSTYQTPFPQAAARYSALFGAVPAGSRASTSAILIANASFEAAGRPWDFYGSATPVTSGGRSGASAVMVGVGEGGVEQDVMARLAVGATYRLSGYGYVLVPGETGYLGIKFLSSEGRVLAEHSAGITALQYTRSTLEFTVPVGATSAVAYAYKPRGAGSSAIFDDVVVSPVQ